VIDPLAEIVTLLQPEAPRSKVVSGAGVWSVRREETGNPFYCVVVEGTCRLQIDGQGPIDLEQGDFILIPALFGFVMSGCQSAPHLGGDSLIATQFPGEIRHGDPSGPSNARLLIGHFVFGSPDAALLVSLLPKLIHIRDEPRLSNLVAFVGQEARAMRPARTVILSRLLEVLLIEALRSTAGSTASRGLVRGLADTRLATALHRMHESPAQAWTIALLAKEAALSRSAFFERFNRVVGVAPMTYLLSWRMALAKNLLHTDTYGLAEIAERVGYGSASSFSVAFTRFVGIPPTHYARSDLS
jgi:AraC-like DNA-binding protein